MGKLTTVITALPLPLGVVVLAAGCTASGVSAPGKEPSSAASQALPVPFMVVARYSAKSLGLVHPDTLAIGPDGNLYVTDFRQQVTVLAPAGKVLRRWGRPGSGPGEFKFIAFDPTTPTAIHGTIAVGPDGMVYVSDSGNGRVQVFTPQGRFIRQFGSFGSGKGQFLHASDLVVDQSGNVYVADEQALTVTKFAPAGRWERVTTCQELVGELDQAGLGPLAPYAWLTQTSSTGLSSFASGSPKPTTGHPCTGALVREHSHFFSQSGQFGSLDWLGGQVDNGPYRIINNNTVYIGSPPIAATFHYYILHGDTPMLSPVLSQAMLRQALAHPDKFSAAFWAVSVAYAGLTWKRVPCQTWC